MREIKEEIDLNFANNLKLAVLHYQSSRIEDGVEKPESIHVLFDCGIINKENELFIKVDGKEILEYKFCEEDIALKMLSEPLAKRVCSYLRERSAVYLENGLKKQ